MAAVAETVRVMAAVMAELMEASSEAEGLAQVAMAQVRSDWVVVVAKALATMAVEVTALVTLALEAVVAMAPEGLVMEAACSARPGRAWWRGCSAV